MIAVALRTTMICSNRCVEKILGSARTCADLGRHFGGSFYEREATYLRETEWARTAADILERRTKHGLHLTPAQRAEFEAGI